MTDPSGTRPQRWSGDDVRRVLVVTAHPDDVDFGAAGTVATLTARGVDVAYCIVTSGEAGGSDRSVPRDKMAELRQEEQRAAARQVGVTDVHFLGYPDGRLSCTLELRRDITRVIRTVRPERVITQSPERVWDRIFASHPDHLAAGEAAACAVYPDARNPFAHPELLDEEGLEPHTVGQLWLMAGPEAQLAVDITAAFSKKVAALLSHQSQISDPVAFEARIRQWAEAIAARAGMPSGSLGEVFRVVETG